MSVPNVQTTVRPALISLVEDHLTGLIRESVGVQRHCKRARIHLPSSYFSSDSSLAKEPAPKRRLHADDINMALQWRGSEKIYATATVGGNSSEDKKINLEDYIKSELELRPPQEVGLTVHWLAVDGVQPDIPRNPASIAGSKSARPVTVEESPSQDSAEDSTPTSGDGVQVAQLMPRLLSEELQLYFNRVITAIERGGANPTTRQQQDAALASLAKDGGLQELVPFFVNYVCDSISKHVENPEHTRTLVRMARSLLTNTHLHLELHLHLLLPALSTCVVAERLSSKSRDNHWPLRREAAVTLVQLCNQFGEDYPNLQPRVLGIFYKASGPDRCLPTQYGGFMGISLFGPRTIIAFLLPPALTYWKTWETTLDETNDLGQRMELQMCQQVVLDAIGVFLSQDASESPDGIQIQWEELEETFGDRLVMLSDEETDYSTCFI